MTALGPEDVWSYPRPPWLEPVPERVRIVHQGTVVADTTGAYRVLETSHPPTFYLPPDDVITTLAPAKGQSMCEWKGLAAYFDVLVEDERLTRAAWTYAAPTKAFAPIAGYLSFYPWRFGGCFVGEMRATGQQSDFYGGWITPNLKGPFKGPSGTGHW
ncbi:MAG: DUF427 domain-containing protein [Pseudomonadota bacterium]